jgi:DNA-binding NtrC family response regulator
MIRLGYLDENKGNRNTFNRIFKKDFEVVMLDDFTKVFTLDLLLEEIDRQEIQALAVDYKLAEKGDVQYDGNQVLEVINERKRYFPVFMMTSYVDAAIQKVNNAFLVNDKDGLNDPKTVELLKNKIKGSVESYHRIIHDVEQRTKELEAKQDTADGLSEDEEKELLNLHVELSKIDPASNPLSPDKMQTGAIKNLRSIVSLSEEILKSLNK